jgi:hypothetical protein
MTPTLSIIVATKGRPTLMRTIHSVVGQLGFGDELIVEKSNDHPQGHAAMNRLMSQVTGDVLLGSADDDYFVPGALDLIRNRYAKAPDRIHVFKMRYTNNTELWATQDFACGNVSMSMTAIPNRKEWLGRFGEEYNSDFDFLAATRERMPDQEIVWHEEVVQIIELPARRGGVEH